MTKASSLGEVEKLRIQNQELQLRLAESEVRYRQLFNKLHESVVIQELVVDENGKAVDLRYIEINDAAEKHLGKCRSDIYGKTRTQLSGIVDPEGLEMASQVASTGIPRKLLRQSPGFKGLFESITYALGSGLIATLAFDVSDRKQSDLKIKDLNWRLASIIESTNVGTWEWNVQTGETVFNEQWAKIIGFTLDELSPLNISVWEKYAHPDDLEQSNSLLQRHFAGELPYYDYECRLKHRDGHWVWVHDRGRVITRTEDGKPLMMFGTHTDITERKKAENTLKESQENLSAIFNATDESVILILADETIVALNDTAAKRMGSSTSKIIGQKVYDLFPPEVVAHRQPMIKQVAESGLPVVFEDHRNGRWLINRIYPILDEIGKISRMAVFARDFTEQKQAENALRESESHYRLLAENVTDIIWVKDMESNTFRFVSPSVERLLGYSVEDVMTNGVDHILTADSLEYMRKVIPGRIDRFKNGFREIFSDELEHVHKNGSIVWVKTNSQIMLNPFSGRIEATGVMHDITEHKRMQDSLSGSEARFYRLYESASLGIFQSTPDGKVISVNPSFAKMFGYNSPQEVKDKILNISIDIFADPNRRDEILRLIEKTPELKSFENIYRRKDGSTFVGWLNVTRINDPDGRVHHFEGFIEDITDRKLAEEKLQAINSIMELAMQTANMAWWEMDITTGAVIFEKRKAEMLGYPPERFKHFEDFTNLIHPEDYHKAMNAMRRHFDGEADKYEVEYRILTNAGEYKWFYDSGSIVKRDIHKIPIVVAGLVIDITARKQTELQIQLQNEDLQKLNATKDKFFSIISHDLRSPFNGILGFSTILVDQIEEKNFDGIEEYARIVKNSAQRALSLLMNLLEWSRSQTGLVKFSPEYVEIGILIDEVANLFVEMAQQKSIELSIELPSKVIAFGDKDMLGCILRNLISNALKFTNPGGHIVISAERKPDEILFSVSDNGVGMKKEALGKIFRIDSSSSTKGTNDEKGTGLGLILCKEFVEKHRGKIWAESELGKGSEFKFSIPVKDIGIPQFYADSLS